MIATQTTEQVSAAGASTVQAKPESRRLALLKRMGLFGAAKNGATIARATSSSDLRDAYGLVHDIFVEQDYILPRPGGLRVRPYEAFPETATFVAKVDGKVVGVQSLVLDSPELGLPSDGAFRAELDSIRGHGQLICEATNEAVAADYRRSAVPTELMRAMFAHARIVPCNQLITTVSPGHARFYNFLGFEQISEVRSYSAEVEDPVVVMRIDIDRLNGKFASVDKDDGSDDAFIKSYYFEDNPYNRYVKTWAIVAERMFADLPALRELFVEHSDLLAQCNPWELEAIRQRWGEEVFVGVLESQLAVGAAT